MQTHQREFQEGLATGAAVGGLLVLAGLALLVPTNEFRVRLYFLLEAPGDGSLHGALAAALFVAAAATLTVLRGLTWWRLGGAALAALLHVLLLSEGAWRWLPEFSARPVGVGVFLLGAALGTLVLRRLRRAIRSTARVTEPAAAV